MKATHTTIVRDPVTGQTAAFTATWDVTPAPGTILSDLGHGVTVVRRNPPNGPSARVRPGCQWVAPFAVNCAAHGWIDSRATAEQADTEGRAHLAADHDGTMTPDELYEAQREALGVVTAAAQAKILAARKAAS